MRLKTCRLCSSDNLEEVIDVGKTTPANNFNDTHEKNNFENILSFLIFVMIALTFSFVT